MSEDLMTAFVTYEEAFEAGYAGDSWNPVDACLSDDIVWNVGGVSPPLGGTFSGRTDVLNAIEDSCNSFDRRFDVREPLATEDPVLIPGGVYFPFQVTYRRNGLPPAVLHGMEWDFFTNGKMTFHREIFLNIPELIEFVGRHNDALLPARRRSTSSSIKQGYAP
jgi:ketosteroid isomerase-like protein